MAEFKTNVMRMLDKAKVNYKHYTYTETDAISGIEVATVLKQNPLQVFKTLVTVGKSGQHYVFLIPVEKELDLKKASHAVDEKSVEMLKSKELLPLTGYIHGGCSPIGLKKQFPVFIDETAQLFDKIYVSGGRRGFQVGLNPSDLLSMANGEYKDLSKN